MRRGSFHFNQHGGQITCWRCTARDHARAVAVITYQSITVLYDVYYQCKEEEGSRAEGATPLEAVGIIIHTSG